jgi:hypothetical protein
MFTITGRHTSTLSVVFKRNFYFAPLPFSDNFLPSNGSFLLKLEMNLPLLVLKRWKTDNPDRASLNDTDTPYVFLDVVIYPGTSSDNPCTVNMSWRHHLCEGLQNLCLCLALMTFVLYSVYLWQIFIMLNLLWHGQPAFPVSMSHPIKLFLATGMWLLWPYSDPDPKRNCWSDEYWNNVTKYYLYNCFISSKEMFYYKIVRELNKISFKL